MRDKLALGCLRTSPDPLANPVGNTEADVVVCAQDLTNIQPKKPNWDLKRDLERKLAKLKPKTDHAISTLIRTSAPSPCPHLSFSPIQYLRCMMALGVRG